MLSPSRSRSRRKPPKAADLVDTLSGPGPFTVFAPTNDAFAKIDAATLTALVAADPGDELDEPLRLVSGAIPKDLRGTLYVNGPARVIDGRGRAAHPLDGHGFVRAFNFQEGEASIRGRFVRTWAFEVESFFDRNLFRGFFSLPFAPSTTVSKSPLVTFTPSSRHSDRDNVASIA